MSQRFPVELQTYGARRYTTSTLLKSSASLGWSTIGAELRSHGIVETPVVATTHAEVAFVALGNEDCLITRTGTGQTQQKKATTGTIWLSPVGVSDKTITSTAPVPKALHLFLPATLFRRLGDDFNLPGMPAHSIRFAAGVRDEMIEQIGLSIISEMTNESAAGRMFVETASLMLAARLLHKYCDSGARSPVPSDSQLNHVRVAPRSGLHLGTSRRRDHARGPRWRRVPKSV